jgi:CheY-like chemotaxis protein
MPRILFVEDNPEMIDELVAELQEKQPEWILEFACNGQQAVKQLQKHVYDCVVLDIMLPSWRNVQPHGEGIYLARWILQIGPENEDGQEEDGPHPDNKNVPIVFLTSRSKAGVGNELQKLGIAGCKIIGRLEKDEVGQAEMIIAIVKNRIRGRKNA